MHTIHIKNPLILKEKRNKIIFVHRLFFAYPLKNGRLSTRYSQNSFFVDKNCGKCGNMIVSRVFTAFVGIFAMWKL